VITFVAEAQRTEFGQIMDALVAFTLRWGLQEQAGAVAAQVGVNLAVELMRRRLL
jgi:hypothetical protein